MNIHTHFAYKLGVTLWIISLYLGKVKVLVAQSGPTLCNPMDCSPPSFSGQEYWSGLPFPSPQDLLIPGIKPGSSALQAYFLLSEPIYGLKCPCIVSSASLKYRAMDRVGNIGCLSLTNLAKEKIYSPCMSYTNPTLFHQPLLFYNSFIYIVIEQYSVESSQGRPSPTFPE